MTTTNLRVLVYGATGSQSGPLVGELLKQGHQPVVLTRSAAKAAHFAEVGATVVEGDVFNLAQLTEINAGIDVVALLIPFGLPNPVDAATYGRNAIDAAKAAGVKLIIWNASGPFDLDAPEGSPDDTRRNVYRHLQDSGIPHITFTPTIYAENLLGPWTAPAVAAGDEVPYATPPAMRVGWIASSDLAALQVAAMERPELSNRIIPVSGIEALSGPELAEAFSAALGRTFRYRGLTPAEFGAILDNVFGPGAGAGAAAVYGPLWEMQEPPTLAVDMSEVLRLLPVQMQTVRQWIAAHAHAFGVQQEAAAD